MARFIQRLAWIGAVSLLAAGVPAMGSAQAAQHPARPGTAVLRPSRLTAGDGLHGGVRGLPAAGARAMLLRAGAATRAGGGQGFLFGVNFRSAASGWAVGLSCRPNCGRGVEDTLIQHWNGRAWSRVPSPSPSPIEGLFSVSAASAKDAWAVGVYATRADAFATLILHWNGTRWSRVPSPDPGPGADGLDGLRGVTSVSARNAWAVGSFCVQQCQGDGEVDHALIMHWNGTRWSRVPSPGLSTPYGVLNGVSAVSARNVWAAGTYLTKAGNFQLLILHWNGTRWSRVASPHLHPGDNELLGVTAVSARNAWAVGGLDHTLILHWNGTRWSRVASPDPGTGPGGIDVLNGVTSVSARNAWAVGSSCAKHCQLRLSGNIAGRMLILHWNGTRWSKVASPIVGRGGDNLSSISAISATSAWAVGNSCAAACQGGGVIHPLMLRWNGTRWSAR